MLYAWRALVEAASPAHPKLRGQAPELCSDKEVVLAAVTLDWRALERGEPRYSSS